MSAYAPIERLFDPANGIFTVATAARLPELRPTDEYETRIRVGKFISIMQLKAKLLVRSAGGR